MLPLKKEKDQNSLIWRMSCFRPYIAFIFLIFFINPYDTKDHINNTPKVYQNAAVVSAHPIATKIGVEIMNNGGNAFDACVATQFALAVVYPVAGNIGGGGFSVIVDKDGNKYCLDFREKAPLLAHRDMFLDSMGNVIENLSLLGVMSWGIPGTVHGMYELHKRFGSLEWKDLITPSVKVAKNGWALTSKEAKRLNEYLPQLKEMNGDDCYLTLQNEYFEGDSISNSELANTLQLIADSGSSVFYEGSISIGIVANSFMRNGNFWPQDLKKYKSKWREPLIQKVDEFEIVSMPPPSSGGIALSFMLKSIFKFPIKEWGKWNSQTLHHMNEIERKAYADRSKFLGDPDFVDIPIDKLLADEYINVSINSIDKDKANRSEDVHAAIFESEETTHFSIIDKWGNAIATTTTLNGAYGSKVVTSAGFLMNNQMDDFSIKPGYPNQFGLIGDSANAIEGGKRMLSSMTPTIVLKNNKPKLILGSPGGSKIITSVYQVILNTLVFDYNIQEAVNLPRFHHQWLPDSLYYEDGFMNYADSLELAQKGHYLRHRKPIGRVDAIYINDQGELECGADFRGDDFAFGY